MAHVDSKPTQRPEATAYSKKQEFMAGNIPVAAQKSPVYPPSVDNSRRTEKISMYGRAGALNAEALPRDVKPNPHKDDNNRSYSINSFTNPKIRQTVNEHQMLQNMQDNRHPECEELEELRFGDPDGNMDPVNEVDLDQDESSLQARGQGAAHGKETRETLKVRYSQPSDDEDEEEQESKLTPVQTFGFPKGSPDELKDRSGLKLASYDVWTKERVKQLLPDKKNLNNRMELVVTNNGSQVTKRPVSSSTGGMKKHTKKSSSQSRQLPDNGAQVIGIDLSEQRKKTSVSSQKIHKKESSTVSTGKEAIKNEITMKQKDFGAFPQGTSSLVQMYGQQKCYDDQMSASTLERQALNQREKAFFKPPVELNPRDTAEFGSSMVQADSPGYGMDKTKTFKSLLERPDSQDDDRRSEMKESSKGYYDIQMEKLKRKRETSETKSARSIKTTKSAISKIDLQRQKILDNKIIEINKAAGSGRLSVSSLSKKSNEHIDKLYRHAFAKKEIQAKIKQEIDKQNEDKESKLCTFRPQINKNSKRMASPADYSMNSYKMFQKHRPMSASSRISDDKSQKSQRSERPLSVKSDMVNGHSSPKVSSQPIVLSIKRSDIQKEIAELEKTNLVHMFFKKKTANKVTSVLERSELKLTAQRQPTRPSLKSNGKFTASALPGKPIRSDPNVLREIDLMMKENDVLVSMGGIRSLTCVNTEVSSISDGLAHLQPRLKSLD